MSNAEPVRGEIRIAGYTRVSHGLYLPPAHEPDQRAAFLRRLEAWLLVLPPDAVFTHLTAAMLLGWTLPAVPAVLPVFAATRQGRRPRRLGLICSRLTHDSVAGLCEGLPIDSPAEILLRCARDLGVLDLVILLDSALRCGSVTRQQVADICLTGRPGVRVLRRALELSDARSESAMETGLRVFHELAGIPVEPQAVLHDSRGRFLARVDLLVSGTRLVHEYDGAGHRDSRRHSNDLRRDRRLAESSYVRRGFTADDLLNHPLAVLQELDRAVGRRHRASRIAAWRMLLGESLYGERGRERILNRWRRQVGLHDWARLA